MSSQVRKGDIIYKPTKPEKYMGKGQIVCRSSWEIVFCKWCNNNPSVLQWSSEPLAIPYIDQTSKDYKGLPKKRRYYPDFLCKIKNKNGIIDTWLVEIKPAKETIPPRKGKNKSQKTKLYEAKTWAVNQAKWKSAEHLCKKRGWKWKILTERHLIKK